MKNSSSCLRITRIVLNLCILHPAPSKNKSPAPEGSGSPDLWRTWAALHQHPVWTWALTRMESYQSERRHIRCKLGVRNNGRRENDVEQKKKTWTWQIAATIMRHKGLMSTPSLAAVYSKWQTWYMGFINAKNSPSKRRWPTFLFFFFFTLNSTRLAKNHVLFKCHLSKWNPGSW